MFIGLSPTNPKSLYLRVEVIKCIIHLFMTFSIPHNDITQEKSSLLILNYILFELNLFPRDYLPSIMSSWMEDLPNIPSDSQTDYGYNNNIIILYRMDEIMEFLPKILNSISNDVVLHVKEDVDIIYDNLYGKDYKVFICAYYLSIEYDN